MDEMYQSKNVVPSVEPTLRDYIVLYAVEKHKKLVDKGADALARLVL